MDLKSIFPQEKEWATKGKIKPEGYKQSTRYKRAPARRTTYHKARHCEEVRRGDLFADVDYQRYLDAVFHCRQITTGCALVMTWVFWGLQSETVYLWI